MPTTAPPPSCQVETYSGSGLHERVRRFTWEGRWLEVDQTLARWREPRGLNFKVTVPDGRVFLLKYDLGTDAWCAQPASRRE